MSPTDLSELTLELRIAADTLRDGREGARLAGVSPYGWQCLGCALDGDAS